MARPRKDWLANAAEWLEEHEARARASRDPDEPAHARLGPSSAARWLRCPGSVRLSDEFGEDNASEFAAEGTVAHHIREVCLKFGLEPEDFVGLEMQADGYTFEVDDEMAAALRPGIEWVRERPGLLVVEYRVRLDRWLPGQFGTLDVGIVSPDLITINDLKFGRGIPVSADHNEQLMTYALGFWDNVARHLTDATEFLLVIDQPRRADGGGEWRTTLDQLLEHGERLRKGYAEVNAQDPYLCAGEKQCKVCPAKGMCPELARWSAAQMDLVLDDLDGDGLTVADVDAFSAERRAFVARHKGLIEDWLKAVYARVLQDAMRGEPTPGLKAVRGRAGNRRWADEKAAKRFLERHLKPSDFMSDPVLLSPAKVEEKLPPEARDEMKEYVTQSEGAPSLVPKDDPRTALVLADQLDDLD